MWVYAIQDYYHSRTGKKMLTESKQYQVIRSHRDEYTLRNDSNKIVCLKKDLFKICEN